jgi:hypothetical protein
MRNASSADGGTAASRDHFGLESRPVFPFHATVEGLCISPVNAPPEEGSGIQVRRVEPRIGGRPFSMGELFVAVFTKGEPLSVGLPAREVPKPPVPRMVSAEVQVTHMAVARVLFLFELPVAIVFPVFGQALTFLLPPLFFFPICPSTLPVFTAILPPLMNAPVDRSLFR